VPDPLAGEGDQNSEEDPELTWEKTESGAASSESEWESSNELPAGGGGQAGQEGELAGNAGGVPGSGQEGQAPQQGNQDNGDSGGTEAELEGALQDFDGEILAERDVLKSTEGASSSVPIPNPSSGPSGDNKDESAQQRGGPLAQRRIPNVPAPPSRTGEIPDDIPDAKDEDIIARQLREAAMQEEDPDLKDKLWDEYRRYNNG